VDPESREHERRHQLTPARCAEMIRRSDCTVALTGAGVSTAAGIPDFRGPEGIYASGRYDAATVFDIDHFRRDPREFYRFTRDLAEQTGGIEPTVTHRVLARMEREELLEAVITQNIDPLHRQAGSRRVLSVHGDYATSHCLDCGRAYSFDDLLEKLDQEEVPRCRCAARGVLKPDVVFFGEQVKGLEEACRLAESAELMLVLGSSLAVYPVAMLPSLVTGSVVVVNQGPVSLSGPGEKHVVADDLDRFFAALGAELFGHDERG
jgi:NAD-dependent deacetylase